MYLKSLRHIWRAASAAQSKQISSLHMHLCATATPTQRRKLEANQAQHQNNCRIDEHIDKAIRAVANSFHTCMLPFSINRNIFASTQQVLMNELCAHVCLCSVMCYICICARTYVCMHAMYACMYVCMYASTHVCMYVCPSVSLFEWMGLCKYCCCCFTLSIYI